MYNRTGLGLRGHLTLVGALILELHIFDLQRPALGVRGEYRLKALIRYEGGLIHGEDVPIPHAEPRDGLLYQLLDLRARMQDYNKKKQN